MLIRRPSATDADWHEPKTTAVENEAKLQELIQRSPRLVPGIADGPVAVALELPLGTGRADVVLIEGDGSVTIVECKLSQNPDIRRTVVGQLFAYAASLWKTAYEDLNTAFATGTGQSLVESLTDGSKDFDEEIFRQVLGRNLERGAFRLAFAVDEITDELKETVLYLNRHTTEDLTVLALELLFVADGDVEILVPHTYGEESGREKATPRPRPWSESELLAALAEWKPPKEGGRMRMLYEKLVAKGARASWGRARSPGVTLWLGEDPDPAKANPVSIGLYTGGGWPPGVAISFVDVRERRSESEMRRLAELMRELPGVASYFEGLEEKNWGMVRSMAPADVLPNDDAVTNWVDKVVEAARPPDQRGP